MSSLRTNEGELAQRLEGIIVIAAKAHANEALARKVVRECVLLTERLGLDLDESELMAKGAESFAPGAVRPA